MAPIDDATPVPVRDLVQYQRHLRQAERAQKEALRMRDQALLRVARQHPPAVIAAALDITYNAAVSMVASARKRLGKAGPGTGNRSKVQP